MHVFATKSVVK